jgi:hypothetical protein
MVRSVVMGYLTRGPLYGREGPTDEVYFADGIGQIRIGSSLIYYMKVNRRVNQ